MEEESDNYFSDDDAKPTISAKRMKLSVSPTHGFVRRSSRSYKGKRDHFCESEDEDMIVDFNKLQVNTLRKFKRIYGLQAPVNITKQRLATICHKCFLKIELEPADEIIAYFIHNVKNRVDDSLERPTKKGRRAL